MASWVADPYDLQSYLGLSSIDQDRAALILALAQELCETIVLPLPVNARAVVLAVAARAFTNAAQMSDAQIGTAHVQYAAAGGTVVGGLYLSRGDKATLRRLNGGGGAFSIDPLPKGVAAVQQILIDPAVTGGTFTLAFTGQSTVPISYAPTASDIMAALSAVTAIGSGNVSVVGTNPFTVTYTGVMATTPVPLLVADSTDLVGGLATVTQLTAGVLAAGQGLPPWDFDYYNSATQFVPGGFA